LQMFTEKTKKINVGDPFQPGVDQGPQVSQLQYDVSLLFLLEFPLCIALLWARRSLPVAPWTPPLRGS
jgi:hypothetical protein